MVIVEKLTLKFKTYRFILHLTMCTLIINEHKIYLCKYIECNIQGIYKVNITLHFSKYLH